MPSLALFVFVLAAVPVAATQVQQAGAPTPVASINELRAETPEELELARHFAPRAPVEVRPGEILIRPGISERTEPISYLFGFPTPTTPSALEWAVCTAPAVIVGEVEGSRVRVTESGTGTFTAYRIHVSRWIRPFTLRDRIVAGQWGGNVEVAGKAMVSIRQRPEFEIQPGRPMLMVLNPLQSGAYLFLRAPIAFQGGVARVDGMDATEARLLDVAANCR
jgi:hypothetical protein